ncbi:MAG: RDD family protein [Myxococcaceae bacterium]|nr:RDD family protein [Myxococcaceae bacterium]
MTDDRLHLDGQHSVLTPEYVEFDFVLAGLFSRFLAWLADTFVTIVLAIAIVFLPFFALYLGGAVAVVGLVLLLVRKFGARRETDSSDLTLPIGLMATGLLLSLGGLAMNLISPAIGGALVFILYFLVDWGYGIFLEGLWSGQTIGKRLFGLRVIQESGVRVSWLQALLRNLARPVDRLPLFYLVGGAAALFTQSQQRLGDLLAGTVVVRERRLKIPASLTRPEGDTALLGDPDFRARVAKLSADEETVLFAAAMRREELGMEARLHLFSTLSQRLQDELGFFKPPHLSDEKLVLLVTASLAARKAEKSLLSTRRKAPPPPGRTA